MTILESERLLFRPHQLSDLDAFCALEADHEVRRYIGGAPRTREAAERKFREVHLKGAGRKLALQAVIYKPELRYIGYCGLYPNFRSDGLAIRGEASLGFTFARGYWGRGLATEAGQAFVRFGFEHLHLTRIVATAEIGNAASLRVLEKLGFVLTASDYGQRSFHKFELLNPQSGTLKV